MHLHYLNEFSYIYLALYLIKLINIIEYLYSTCSKEIQLRLWQEKETIVYLSFFKTIVCLTDKTDDNFSTSRAFM